MEQFLEKVMNFINENTMLLILICIFLIIVLVIYLIDNSIKTKRLEQEELAKKNNPETPTVLNSNPDVIPVEDNKEETPVVEETEVKEPEAVTEPEVKEEPPVVPIEEIKEEVETPVETATDINIDDLLNRDYSVNNEVVNNMPEAVVEEPKMDVTKIKYTNDKKLSDIFGKKEEKTVRPLETTQDFSDELDRILQKLNSEENNTLEETNDYTNMF
jgi:hypothetical protein